jgi:hypothetical protein
LPSVSKDNNYYRSEGEGSRPFVKRPSAIVRELFSPFKIPKSDYYLQVCPPGTSEPPAHWTHRHEIGYLGIFGICRENSNLTKI